MKVKKLKSLAMGLGMSLFVLAGCGGSESESDAQSGDGGFPEMTITFSHNQPIESPEHVGAEKFKEVVEEQSGGNITVEVYPASQLGSLREQVESTQIGEINITMQPSAVVSPFVDDVKLIDLPYLWPKEAEEKYRVLDSEVGEEVLDTLNSGGFEGLGYWPGGYKLFTTKDTAVQSPEDLEGLTMRVMESPLLIAQYENWGANAIPVPYAEVYNSLQQGVVDGQENPLQTIFLNNYHEVQNNIIESYHGTMTYLLMANQGWFEELSPEVQELVLQAEEEGKQAARDALKETEADYRQQIIDSGVEYYELTDEEVQVFREASEPFYEEVITDAEQLELLEKIQAEIGNN